MGYDQNTYEKLLRAFGDDEIKVSAIYYKFETQALERCGAMRRAYEARAFDDLRSSAHALAGTAGTVGATHVRALSQDVHNAPDAPDALQKIEALQQLLENAAAAKQTAPGKA